MNTLKKWIVATLTVTLLSTTPLSLQAAPCCPQANTEACCCQQGCGYTACRQTCSKTPWIVVGAITAVAILAVIFIDDEVSNSHSS